MCVGLIGSVVIVLLTRWWKPPANPVAVSSSSLGPTATLITAGPHADEVLLSGTVPARPLETALYNPATNTLSIGPSMNRTREGASATLLRNGQLLVAGGGESLQGSLQQSELYDPVTDKFVPTGNMIYGRELHSAMLLPNGKVLIAGGVAVPVAKERAAGLLFPVRASTELFDPATKTFAPGPPMNTGRVGAFAILRPDGKVLIAGGADGAGNPLASTEIYDPSTGTISAGPNMNVARGLPAAVVLNDDRVAIFGGLGTSSSASTEFYDPAKNAFTPGPSMSVALEGVTATKLDTGKVLIIGIIERSNRFIAQTELYEPATNMVVAGPTVDTGNNIPRTLTRLGDGRILIASVIVDPTEIYDPATDRISDGPRLSPEDR